MVNLDIKWSQKSYKIRKQFLEDNIFAQKIYTSKLIIWLDCSYTLPLFFQFTVKDSRSFIANGLVKVGKEM